MVTETNGPIWRILRHGEPGGHSIEILGQEEYLRSVVNRFQSRGVGHYVELFDPVGDLVLQNPQQKKPDA